MNDDDDDDDDDDTVCLELDVVWKIMASKVKKESQEVPGVSVVDIQYVNTGRNSEDISWAGIVLNAQSHNAENNTTSSENDLPVSAMLAMDCEADDNDNNVELEMTVTSEFTLVGYDDENDDLLPDEEALKNYVDSSGDGLKHKRQWMSPPEQNGESTVLQALFTQTSHYLQILKFEASL